MRGKIFRWSASDKRGWIRTAEHEDDIVILNCDLPAVCRSVDAAGIPCTPIGLTVDFELHNSRAVHVYLVTGFNPEPGDTIRSG
jgi:hypothetical protein